VLGVLHTSARKLDGHTLYSASHVQGEGFARAVVACFDTPHASSDGGAILLKSVDTHLGLTKRLARCLVDERRPDQRRECHEILHPKALTGVHARPGRGPRTGTPIRSIRSLTVLETFRLGQPGRRPGPRCAPPILRQRLR